MLELVSAVRSPLASFELQPAFCCEYGVYARLPQANLNNTSRRWDTVQQRSKLYALFGYLPHIARVL